jgi:hypothetical protein
MLVMAILVAVLAPVAVIAAGGQFTDDDTSVFEADIEWMASTGITFGCNPPANDNYCPTKAVNRGQMAAFMHRLAMNQVVDAKTALTAGDAEMLMGEGPTHFDNPAYGITCNGSTCPDVGALATAPILEMVVTAPEAGYFTLVSQYSGIESGSAVYLQSWTTMDVTAVSGCGSWFGGPLETVPGMFSLSGIDGGITFATNSAAAVVPVTAGNHTLRLCALGINAVTSQAASLTATFTAEGAVTTASTSSVPDYSYLNDAFGEFKLID